MVPLEYLGPGSAVVGEPVAVLADLGVGADQPLDLRVGGAVVRAPVGLPPQFVSLKFDKLNVPSKDKFSPLIMTILGFRAK